MRASLAICAVLLVACIDLDETRPLGVGPIDTFSSEVQPALSIRCASAACHGREDRALALYAPGAYRMDPSRRFLDEPLTTDELELNAARIAAFDSLAIRKPLAEELGGAWHGGGDVLTDPEDPLYLALLAWLNAAPF